jgi:putative endonuclease
MEGFTKRYDVTKLVYYEAHSDIKEAIRREKNMQAWKRKWKTDLIEKNNPAWHDLFEDICR